MAGKGRQASRAVLLAKSAAARQARYLLRTRQMDTPELISTIARDRRFSGVIALDRAGEAPIELAFGFRNRSEELPNDVDTRLGSSSGSKIFTAVAIGILIQQGRLDFTTKLADCVRSETFHFGDQVTVGQLLSHTSGVPDYFDEELQTSYADVWQTVPCYRMRSIAHFLPLFRHGPMKFPAGERFAFSNAGYILLGLIIEEIGGISFPVFVREAIFRPLGMERSGYFSLDQPPANTAIGYIPRGGGRLTSNAYAIPIRGGPDGGAFVTVGDMRRFWRGLLDHKLLDRGMLEKFLAPRVQIDPNDPARSHSYGVWIRTTPESGVVHSTVGSDPGVSMLSKISAEHGWILTVLSNVQDGAWSVARQIGEQVLHA